MDNERMIERRREQESRIIGRVRMVGLTNPGSGQGDVFELTACLPGASTGIPMHDATATIWRDVRGPLSRSLPCLWGTTTELTPHVAWRGGTTPRVGTRVDPGVLDGPSYGVAFAIAQASARLELPVADPSIVATGIVEGDGRIGPVDGIATKVRALAASSFDPVTLLVADDAALADEAESAAERIEGAAITVRRVEHLADVMRLVFGDVVPALQTHWYSLDDAGRERFVNEHLNVALTRPYHAVNWAPVARAAAQIREWESDGDSKLFERLGVVQAIAARYARLPMQPQNWVDQIARLPALYRVAAVAHATQQCADFGVPSRSDLEPTWQRYCCVEGASEETSTEVLKIWGARARAEHTHDHADAAVGINTDVTRAWMTFAPAQASYSLCAGILAATLADDSEALEGLLRIHDELTTRESLVAQSKAFVEVALAHSHWLQVSSAALARGPRPIGPSRASLLLALRGITSQPNWSRPLHVRSLRWLALLDDDRTQWMRQLAAMRDAEQSSDLSTEATISLAFIALVEAVLSGAEPTVSTALEEFVNLDRARCEHILSSAPSDADDMARARHLLRLYPY